MAAYDYTDFYIIDSSFNKFNDTELIEDDLIRIIIQKYQVIVYTTKGDVMGDYNLGSNLLDLLYQTRLAAKDVEDLVKEQIYSYITEITQTPFTLTVRFEQDPGNYQDVMFIEFKLDEYQIVNQIGNFL